MHQRSGIRRLKFPQSDTKQLKTVITPLSASQPRLFPLGKKLSFTRRGVCWPSRGPCEHPFQTEGERDHPSAGLLRIFMTGWCHSGCSLAGLLQGSPRQNKTLMTHQMSWLEGTAETKRQTKGCRLHPDVETETYVHGMLKKWRLKYCYYHWK